MASSPGARDERSASVDEAIGRLSTRHLDVLGLIADGRSNKEIATALGITPATVKGYVEDILLALGVPNRAAAVALWAAELARREPERADEPHGAPRAE